MKAVFLFLITCITIFDAHGQRVISLNSVDKMAQWQLKPQDEIGSDSTRIYSVDYDTEKWVKAVVPGAVFTSFVEAGIEEDPNYGDNIYRVNRKKYDKNFWYRTIFETPVFDSDECVWLHFEGVNRKGEVFLNGFRLGELDGFMDRGNFNITRYLHRDSKNVLAVLVKYPPDMLIWGIQRR